MAVTQTYVDFGAGSDYNGASFTDGAYTSATKVLAKNGAFTRTKVNHWLYLSSNAGGSIVAGYYKVATATDANSVILATDAGAGVDATDVKCTQATGTALLPFRSIQGALDIITRDATNGDQINIKASTAQVNQAALTLVTYGTPTIAAPLTLRGYTTAANDGGLGAIDCNGATMWAATTYDCINLVDLEMYSFGNNHGIQLDTNCLLFRCKVHQGASSPSSKTLVIMSGIDSQIVGCYLHDAGTSGGCILLQTQRQVVLFNFIDVGTSSSGISSANLGASVIANNIIKCGATGATGIAITGTGPSWIFGNSIYNSAAGTARGINMGNSAGRYAGAVINNIVEGFSGVGGIGIGTSTAGIFAYLVGWNAFYNNTTTYSITSNTFIDATTNDSALGASPFVAPASNNFAINGNVVGVTEAAWPTSFNGASSTNKAEKGAVQSGAGAGGAVSISPTLGSVGAA